MRKSGLNNRQHRFCLNILAGMPPQEAYVKAGYSNHPGNLTGAPYQIVSDNPSVKAFIEEKRRLKEAIILSQDVNNAVATPQERKMILTELLRAQLVDFQDEHGEPRLSKDVPNHRAAKEYEVAPGKFGTRKRIKLSDPISAIQELNKMDGSYAPSKHLHGVVRYNVSFVEKGKNSTGSDSTPVFHEER